jgi:hypothetical protein
MWRGWHKSADNSYASAVSLPLTVAVANPYANTSCDGQ